MVLQTLQPKAQDETPDSLVLSFGDITAKREPIIIGGSEYSAYVWDKRVPRSVRAQVFDAYREVRDSNRKGISTQLAQENAITRALMAMIPGLGYSEADCLDPQEVETIQIKLHLISDPRRPEQEIEPSPQNGVTETKTQTRPTGVKSSSASRRRSA